MVQIFFHGSEPILGRCPLPAGVEEPGSVGCGRKSILLVGKAGGFTPVLPPRPQKKGPGLRRRMDGGGKPVAPNPPPRAPMPMFVGEYVPEDVFGFPRGLENVHVV